MEILVLGWQDLGLAPRQAIPLFFKAQAKRCSIFLRTTHPE